MYRCTKNPSHRFSTKTFDSFCPEPDCNGILYLVEDGEIVIQNCPICGKLNQPTNTFQCQTCHRAPICLTHQTSLLLTCPDCALTGTFYGECYLKTEKQKGKITLFLDTREGFMVHGTVEFSGGLRGSGKFIAQRRGYTLDFAFPDKTNNDWFYAMSTKISTDIKMITGNYLAITKTSTYHGSFSVEKM